MVWLWWYGRYDIKNRMVRLMYRVWFEALKWVYSNAGIYLAWLTISYSVISDSFQVPSIKSFWLQWHLTQLTQLYHSNASWFNQQFAINVSFRPNQIYIRQAVYFPKAINTISASSSKISPNKEFKEIKHISFWHIFLPKTRFKMTLG